MHHLHSYFFCKVILITYFCNLFICPEYIVTFLGYYAASTRSKYVEAALKDKGVEEWRIVPRANPMVNHPSDFEVVQVSYYFFFHIKVKTHLLSFFFV